MKKVLIVAAHPDDEVLGCGGTIARLAREGSEVYTLILGEGAASRYASEKKERIAREISALKREAEKANKLLGVKKVFLFDFPDNRFDTTAILDIIKVVEKIKGIIKPDIVYTHHKEDLNIDHRIVYDAVLTACRPTEGETVKEIYSFAVPSSTEWAFSGAFAPNLFVDITRTLDIKIKAVKIYKGEMRRFPHPRSQKAIRTAALVAGSMVGTTYAEAFKCVRVIK